MAMSRRGVLRAAVSVPAVGAILSAAGAGAASAGTAGSAAVAGGTLQLEVSRLLRDLTVIDRGQYGLTDLLTRARIGAICRDLGFGTKNWAALTTAQIAPAGPSGPKEVPAAAASAILSVLTAMIDKGAFAPKDGTTFDPTVLNDVLPAGRQFHGKPCLGHLWEFQYGLAVELEHGRSAGVNVTNNHPVLTGMIVLGHVVEDSLYYARLWVMELDGEILNGELKSLPAAELDSLRAEHARAVAYLASRVAEKRAGA